ncbi:transcription-repair coupling factor (superfamily II helicase) [Jatrophihabitans sp. GAS493]|uniref:transcription-repair coupling factor n=1 Tax=Jatrophihabitans sp. GAS493 TaxID=1907575 RepID=UPI000BB69127|nr:transcription-repair coupling factor [Jatrophihabitans sp. GAS493]SOD75214.1 transcription-repair coupling factor (superfamily II helicase) [Jatrophihabitans sp. GAS493]
MSLSGLRELAVAEPSLTTLIESVDQPTLTLTGPPSIQAFAIAGFAARTSRTVLAVTSTAREAEDLVTALGSLLDPDTVALYPGWETLPHERLSPRADTVGQRLAVLRRLAHPSTDDPASGPLSVVVAPVRSVLQPQVPGLGHLTPVSLRAGDTDRDLATIVADLVNAGYSRADLVENRGQFAVRGGILDVFPPTEQHPLRVEFWGDDIEEVRYFKVADQRSLEIAEHGVWAPPCREMLLTDSVRERAAALLAEHPELGELLEPISLGTAVEGMEALAPALVDELTLVLHELPVGTHVIVCDPERVRSRSADLVSTSQEFLAASWAAAAGGGRAPVDLGAASLRSFDEVRDEAIGMGLPWWGITPFGSDSAQTITSTFEPAPTYRGDLEAAVVDLRNWTRDGWQVALVLDGHGTAKRTVERLSDAEVPARLEAVPVPEAGMALVTTGSLLGGLYSPSMKIVVLTETDLTGQRGSLTKDSSRMPTRRRNAIDPIHLAAGDFVVHEQHGVGRYVEMVRRTINGGEREYLIIEYAASKKGQPADRLFVPTDSLDQVTKYVGGEAPSVNRLGGADWAKTKGRARKAVKEIAAELIRLYSARMATKGYAFGPDTPWQRELEDAFAYVETPDQLAAIDEVKADMQKSLPMDRVICGDVGYGKTEVAVRAAFKAVQDGKQVAVLVPTTLLAHQHHTTFSERMSQFPVQLRELSRFTASSDADKVLAGLHDGSVDIVIGTHRILQQTVRFKDLGLVIVDEEQRFGVEHKEYLTSLRTSVDVLTMSATPIPRTLEMSLTGIREMTTILTPPEERHPILTFVGAHDSRQIAAAVRRELLRDGQVFYIHNRVESINRAAAKLAELVPEARIAVAHGQMGEDALEQIMLGFWENRFDVLVSTTIVESGLDIPNANTLIVERADMFGLSQLHQLRGRVGRSRERGYAYFLYPPEKPLTELALDRLATIAQHTELGAGMAVAMKDLEIRGAGNLLGGEQSGHIAGVGFDLYVRLVGEAVAEFRGETEQEFVDVKVDLPVDANLPYDYLPGERLRLEAYRALASASSDEAVEAVRLELIDRFGPIPEPVSNLLAVARFKVLARSYGLTEVSMQGNTIRFGPLELAESAQIRLKRLFDKSLYKQAVATVSVPRPKGIVGKDGKFTEAKFGGEPLRDVPLLTWCAKVLADVVGRE